MYVVEHDAIYVDEANIIGLVRMDETDSAISMDGVGVEKVLSGQDV